MHWIESRQKAKHSTAMSKRNVTVNSYCSTANYLFSTAPRASMICRFVVPQIGKGNVIVRDD